MTPSSEEPRARRRPGGPRNEFSELGVALLSALGAGLGGLGFVAVVGSVVTQARFRGAGLPSELSASLAARGLNLAVGIEVISAAAIVASMVVAAVHFVPAQNSTDAYSLTWEPRTWRKRRNLRGVVLCAAIVVAVVGDYFFFWAGREYGHWVQLVFLVGVSMLAIAGAAAATGWAKQARQSRGHDGAREAGRLLCIWAVVAVLGGVAAAAGGWSNPLLRPVVLQLTDPPEIVCGIYVSESSDGVYVGEPVLKDGDDLGDHAKGSVHEFGRERVTTLVVGTTQPLAQALRRAREMAERLTVPSDMPTPGCPP